MSIIDAHATDATDETKAQRFEARVVEDVGAALLIAAVVVGDRLGLYRAMANGRMLSANELAAMTGTAESAVERWLVGQTAAGYVESDATAKLFRLPPEHARFLVDGINERSIPGVFQFAAAAIKDEPLVTEAFRTGQPVDVAERHPDFLIGYERMARARYGMMLCSTWIPAAAEAEQTLRDGGNAAIVGCGRGGVVLLLAREYPRSSFVGLDRHSASLGDARRAAGAARVTDRVSFQAASIEDLPASTFDLIVTGGGAQGTGDVVATVARIATALRPGGTWLLIRPKAEGFAARVATNAAVVASSLSDQVLLAELPELALAGRFQRFRQIGATALDVVYEAGGLQ